MGSNGRPNLGATFIRPDGSELALAMEGRCTGKSETPEVVRWFLLRSCSGNLVCSPGSGTNARQSSPYGAIKVCGAVLWCFRSAGGRPVRRHAAMRWYGLLGSDEYDFGPGLNEKSWAFVQAERLWTSGPRPLLDIGWGTHCCQDKRVILTGVVY